jgi:PAS domain S-box-containing protein
MDRISSDDQPYGTAHERQLQLVVDSLPLMAWTATPDGQINYLNRRWYGYTGQTLEDSLGSGWTRVMPEDTEESVLRRWTESIQHQIPYEAECRYKRHDGNYRWHIARAEPIKNEKGELLYWLGTSTDIHDQKMLSEELEDLVHQRTNELNSSIAALRRSNESLEHFASVASHDLKEPLRKIQFFSDMLRENRTHNVDGLLQKIHDASGRMMTLIEDLLEFSSLTISEELYEEVDLNQVLQVVLGDLELTICEKKAEITIEKLPQINGITHQLEQLFNNLVGNALKYAHPDRVAKIGIWATLADLDDLEEYPALDTKRLYYKIAISDNGIGFGTNESERIFTIFQRLHPRDKYSGTGVGLALCRKVVQNHGGEIFAEGKLGQGSVFYILLPSHPDINKISELNN